MNALESRWAIVVNPISGSCKGQETWQKVKPILEDLNVAYEACFTEKAFHAIELAKAYRDKGYSYFMIIGGDGTINEVVNGVLSSSMQKDKPKFAFIGIGTGNDTIKTFKIPSNPKKALKLLEKGSFRSIDLGKVYYQNKKRERASRYFVNIAGMAFDAAVTDNANKEKPSMGKLAYLKGVYSTLKTYKPVFVRVIIDDKEPIEDIMFSLNVANCKYSGGGMLIAPHAIPDDGIFAITLIKNIDKWKIVRNIYRLFNGTLEKVEEIELYRGKKVRVEGDASILVEVEGELLGAVPFEFEMNTHAIELLTP